MKIFKKLLPVIVGLSLIIVIGITIVIVNVATSKTPKLSNGKENYLYFDSGNGTVSVNKQDLYDALKKNYAVGELTRLIDEQLYANELKSMEDKIKNNTNGEADKFKEYIDEDLFGEDFEGDKEKEWKDILESLVLTGIITRTDKNNSSDYEDVNSPAWNKIKEYYLLQYTKEMWARAEYLKRYQDERKDAGKPEFDEDDIEDYFEENFGKKTTGLYIPFTSSEAAEAMLKKYGISVSDSKESTNSDQSAGWIKTSFNDETVEGDKTYTRYPTFDQYLTPEEVIRVFIAIYNEVWAYTNSGNPLITESDYTTKVSETKTLGLVKNALTAAMKDVATIKGDVILPAEIKIADGGETGDKVEVTWTGIDDENFKLLADEHKIVVNPVSSKITKDIEATLKYGESDIKVTFKVELSKFNEKDGKLEDKEEEKTVVVNGGNELKAVNDFIFNLTNDKNDYTTFVFDSNDSSTYGKYLSSSDTTYTYSDTATDFYKSYSIKPRSVGSFYCLFIKLGETEEVSLDDEGVRDEVIAAMREDLYTVGSNEKANLERMYYVRRQENKLKIYDKFIEAIYEYNYNTFYSSTLSETDYPKFKKSSKTTKKYVASIKGHKFTADELFDVLQEKYGATYVKTYIDQFNIVNSDFNKWYNPWKGGVMEGQKEYVESLLKSSIASFKQNFELDYFTYSYLSYYGFIPNFPSSYGWKDFIHDYYNADSEEELLINREFAGQVYSDTLDEYTLSLYNYDNIKAEMDKLLEKFYKVDVMNLIISVDYDYDSNPDTKIVESNKEDVTKENWTEEQINLVEELAELIMTRCDEVLATGNLSSKLTEVVNVYNKAPYEIVENPTTLSEAFGKYKLAGLQIKFEASANYSNTSSLVDEFKDALVEIWQYAKDNNLVYDDKAAEDDPAYLNPIEKPLTYNLIDGKYAFASSYGYHVVAVEKAYDPVELPTEDEIKLYEASTNLTNAKSSLDSAKSGLDSASGNEVAVRSYKEQVKRYEAEVAKYKAEVIELVKKLKEKDPDKYGEMEGYNEETDTFTLDSGINDRCTAWYTSAKTTVTTNIVEKTLLQKFKDVLSKIQFNGFTESDKQKEQLEFYLEYLDKEYSEEGEHNHD